MKAKKRYVFLGVLVVAGAWFAWSKLQAPKGPTYDSVQVSRGNIDVKILATGDVQPQNRLEIKPPIAGRIEDVRFREGAKVQRGAVLAWMSSAERVALLDAARAKGAEELSRWAEMYRPTPVLAPSSGVLIARKVEPGQTVTASDVILVVSDRLIVKANVDETDLAEVRVGQKAGIVLDAYAKKEIPATVEHIAYEAKTVNNVTVYEVEVVPQEVPEFMRSGMTANVTFFVDRREDVPVLPVEAIRREGGTAFVLTPDANDPKQTARKEVKTGLSDGKTIEIVSGLKDGDTALIDGVVEADSSSSNQTTNPFMPMRPRTGGAGRSGASRGGPPGP